MVLTIKECGYHNAPYIQTSSYGSIFQKEVPQDYRHNIWILVVGNNDPMTEVQAKKDFKTSNSMQNSHQSKQLQQSEGQLRPPHACNRSWQHSTKCKQCPIIQQTRTLSFQLTSDLTQYQIHQVHQLMGNKISTMETQYWQSSHQHNQSLAHIQGNK